MLLHNKSLKLKKQTMAFTVVKLFVTKVSTNHEGETAQFLAQIRRSFSPEL